MARSKKSRLHNEILRAAARDRKRSAARRMRVSGKGVFTLANLKDSKKS